MKLVMVVHRQLLFFKAGRPVGFRFSSLAGLGLGLRFNSGIAAFTDDDDLGVQNVVAGLDTAAENI
jgi:hypothetical protein